MELFVQPLLWKRNTTKLLSKKVKPAATGRESSTISTVRTIFDRLELAVRQACGIYTRHLLQNTTPEETTFSLEKLKDTVEVIPSYCPGEQTLAWVYFVAAAESTLKVHRRFFTTKLRELYERTNFVDNEQSFTMLDRIWDNQFPASMWTKVPMIT